MSRFSFRASFTLAGALLLLPACAPSSPFQASTARTVARPVAVDAAVEATPPPCTDPGDPSSEAYDTATGPIGGEMILPNGRALTPWGTQVTVGTFPQNMVVSPDGQYAYVTNNGDGTQSIKQLHIASGTVKATLKLDRLFHGLAINAAGTRLYAAGGETNEVYEIEVRNPGLVLKSTWTAEGYPTGVTLTPDGSRLFVTANLDQMVLELDAVSGTQLRRIPTHSMPYQVVFSPDGATAYVTQWSVREVSVIDVTAGKVVETLSTSKNPSAMVLSKDGARLYVTASDGDLIEVFGTVDLRLEAQIEVGIYADGYHGASPASLALSLDGMQLFVANGGDNAVEVYDSSTFAYLGAVPTGWYPTALAVSPDGTDLLIANGKGEGAGPNLDGREASDVMMGTVSILALPLSSSQLAEGDGQVTTNNSRPLTLHEIQCAGKMFPVPGEGVVTPIEHVVIILRENKTYDAYLGDLEVGDGDPSLVLFDETVTPNTHALAREFTLLDNFYTDSEDSDQGHLWATAAFVNDFSERQNAAGRVLATGVLPASDTETRYIFDNLLKHGIDWVNYGEVVGLEVRTGHNIDMRFPGVFYNTDIKDEVKADYVVSQIEAGVMPPYTFLLLPNDHTSGTDAGALSPESMVSDNDYAVGMVVDAISKSEFWEKTVIFIFEDDPQIGADHVDAHRSPTIVVSPWSKRGHVSSVLYSIPSIHRTAELILGLPPMTQYDAMATPMYDCFTAIPDYTPYDAIDRQIPDTYNTLETFGAAESREMDFSGPDRNPGLGRLLWRYIKHTEPPEHLFGELEEEDEGD